MLKTFLQHTKFSRATVQFSSTVRCELCSCLFKYTDMCLEVSTVTELRSLLRQTSASDELQNPTFRRPTPSPASGYTWWWR